MDDQPRTLHDPGNIQTVSRILDRQDLDGAERGEQVRVMVWMCSEASCNFRRQ